MAELDGWGEPYVVQVSELIEQLRQTLFESFGEIWVEGEIGSLHESRAGHLYFDLKDELAQLRAVLFRRNAQALPFEVAEGMQVRARARLDLYPERGLLQLVVDELRPCGEGALRQAFERLKLRLHEEGLFDPGHKKPLPFLPRRIGVVTSLQGAAIHDFLRGLRARCPATEVLIYDARVQGEEAWRELVRGLHLLDVQAQVDVIVLTRGGGSIEDLWSFNREELVRAIFALDTPVISAVGHEVDLVLTDLVADARAATPTQAAELVVPDVAILRRQLRELERRLRVRQIERLQLLGHRLEALRRGLVHPAQRLEEMARRLLGARVRLGYAVQRACTDAARRIEKLVRSLPRAAHAHERGRHARLEALGGRLHALSPLAVLGRGYALVQHARTGTILKSSEQIRASEPIEVRLGRGRLHARVTESLPEEED